MPLLEVQNLATKSHLPSLLQIKDENYTSDICLPILYHSLLARKHKEKGEENNYDLSLENCAREVLG